MKFSEAWLREFVEPDVDTEGLCRQLTGAGLEVDSVEPVAADFSGVITGEIITIEPHPDADKLKVCRVDVGKEDMLTIVTNATNVHSGMKIPLAPIGAVLDGGNFKIKKAKLRGVESQGMMCSEVELGLAETSNGIMRLRADTMPGQDIKDVLDLNDVSIDVDLTPNRGDCASVIGMARAVAAINRLEFGTLSSPEVEPSSSKRLNVKVAALELCPHYMGRVIENVDTSIETPLWIKEHLRRSGIRSIDFIVDVTNHVMLELGQPMHAFDLEKIEGDVHVRLANDEEELVLLDDTKAELSTDTLIIADDKKPLAIAGIMGGLDSGVSHDTKHVFLESAYFTPDAIASKPREYNVHSESSYRFERGVDPQLQRMAIERATHIILKAAGGDAGPIVLAGKPESVKPAIFLRLARVDSMLGFSVKPSEIESILQSLNMAYKKLKDGFEVVPPTYRFDLNLEEDLIEEIVRLVGYDKVPLSSPSINMPLPVASALELNIRGVQDNLMSLGYHEIISYSFVSESLQSLIAPSMTPEKLSNPISSDMSVMRTSLWPGLLSTLQHNLKRQQANIRLFETGMCFIPMKEGLSQRVKIGGLISGDRLPLQWSSKPGAVDFYDIKADVEVLLKLTSRPYEFVLGEHSALHPSQSALIKIDGEVVGHVGALHPLIAKKLKLKNVFLFELDFESLKSQNLSQNKPLSKFPSVERDLAIVVEKQHQVKTLFNIIQITAGNQLVDLILFDVYEDDALGKDKHSLAVRLTFQDQDGTLKDEQIDAMMKSVIQALSKELDAEIRE